MDTYCFRCLTVYGFFGSSFPLKHEIQLAHQQASSATDASVPLGWHRLLGNASLFTAHAPPFSRLSVIRNESK